MSHEPVAFEDAPDGLPQPVRRALEAFRARFPAAERAPIVAWAPGRVNLIGEHTDYNEGFVLPIAIDRYVAIAAAPADGQRSRWYSAHHDAFYTCQMIPDALMDPQPEAPLWARLVRAVLAELTLVTGSEPVAFEGAIVGDVPVGGGMSSSAALEVAVATCALTLGEMTLSPLEVARICQRAEHRGAQVEVGVMDQAISCLGRAGQALLLDCRSLAYDYIPAPLDGITLLVFDTGAPHMLAASGYNERRQQCAKAVRLLGEAIHADAPERQVTALRDVRASDLACYGPRLPDTLLRRARHVISENERVRLAVEALHSSDLRRLGALLDASHISLRDDYQVSCLELDAAVEIAQSSDGVLGARMMGAGFGGSALILVETPSYPALAERLAREYPARTGRVGRPITCNTADGAAWRRMQY